MPSVKADLAIYIHVLGVPGQYETVALMLSHKMDFSCCANRDGFRKSSHVYNLSVSCDSYPWNVNVTLMGMFCSFLTMFL